jgi:hypothetical protein
MSCFGKFDEVGRQPKIVVFPIEQAANNTPFAACSMVNALSRVRRAIKILIFLLKKQGCFFNTLGASLKP